jgi:hypothetical protein
MWMRVDFYKVVMPEDSKVEFEGILNEVCRSPDDDTRNIEIRESPVRLRKGGIASGNWEADMTRIRMNMLPVKAKLSGEIEPIRLRDDEGIGEETAFLYHPPKQTLVLQRNMHGVSASALAAYFESKGGLSGPIILEPILQQGAYEKLADLQVVTKFDIRIAAHSDLNSLKNSGHGVASMIDVLTEFQAPHAAISLSMGRERKGSLAVKQVINTAKRVLGLSSGEANPVTKIVVSGRTDDDERLVLDLLQYRLFEWVELDPDEDRRVSYRQRRTALRSTWNKNRAQIS